MPSISFWNDSTPSKWRPELGNGLKRLSGSSGADFEPGKLQDIAEWARIYMLKNLFTRRTVEIQVLYVWAWGVYISGEAPEVDKVLTQFWEDCKNLPVLLH